MYDMATDNGPKSTTWILITAQSVRHEYSQRYFIDVEIFAEEWRHLVDMVVAFFHLFSTHFEVTDECLATIDSLSYKCFTLRVASSVTYSH